MDYKLRDICFVCFESQSVILWNRIIICEFHLGIAIRLHEASSFHGPIHQNTGLHHTTCTFLLHGEVLPSIRRCIGSRASPSHC
eukprot:14900_1